MGQSHDGEMDANTRPLRADESIARIKQRNGKESLQSLQFDTAITEYIYKLRSIMTYMKSLSLGTIRPKPLQILS